ncbi:hypothetical protein OC835_001071 [Tilletia horrida]|nr:hypothetical protein OC835_001071 [Tilletia horrida]
MDFTHSHPHSSGSCLCFSPGSTFLAYVASPESAANTVIVCRSDTLQVASQWSFDEVDIHQLQWSDDGLFLHATNTLHGIVFVLSLDPQRQAKDHSDDDQGWAARLEAGYEGLAAATWAPASGPPTILAFSMHQLRLTAYDLANEQITVFENPKRAKILRSIKKPGVFAVLETNNEADQISIYRYQPYSGLRPSKDEPSGWLIDHSFAIATNDASEVVWSPDGNHFVIAESILEYKVMVYTSSGTLRVTLASEGLERPQVVVTHPSLQGSQGSRSSAIKNRTAKGKGKDTSEEMAVATGGLGVRCITWHPSGQMLAVGGYDEKIRILESESWGIWSTIDLSAQLITQEEDDKAQPSALLRAYREPSNWLAEVDGQGIVDFGVSWMEFNEDGTMLACRNESLPTTIFIYHLPRATAGSIVGTGKSRPDPRLLAVLIQAAPIKAIIWRPRHFASLFFCCGGPAVYSWRASAPSGIDKGHQPEKDEKAATFTHRAECIAVPSEGPFDANDVRWSPDGSKLLVIDSDSFCCAIDVEA